MTINAFWLVLGALGVYAVFYRYYSAFLATKVLVLDDSRPTPAHTRRDGQNFHPTNRWVLWGHHFAAISGAGPLIGPVLAAQFGWLPGFLWLVFGVCLAGAVQDFVILVASIRRGGRSLAEIARDEISPVSGMVAMIAILFIIVVAMAVLLFPFVFVTIACGAISGFHALVSSGTTPKMIDRERDARPIGYGAMLMESLVGVTALVAACSLFPADYFRINLSPPAFQALVLKTGLDGGRLSELAALVGEPRLEGRTGGGVSLAVGIAQIFGDLPGARAFMSYFYHFVIMFEALFVLTTIDTGTRIGRFLVQELLGRVSPRFGRADWLPGSVLATALVVGGWSWFIFTGSIQTLWPMFGVANQLLAVVVLTVATSVLVNEGKGRYTWTTAAPLAFLGTTTLAGGALSIRDIFLPLARSAKPAEAFKGALNAGLTGVMMVCVLLVLFDALPRWWKRGARLRQGLVAGGIVLLASARPADAQSLTVYDDALQNGFLDYSYGGGANFLSATQVHGGARAIAFTGNNFNAVSFAHPSQAFTTSQYPTLHFWVHGGASGGQQLRVDLQLGASEVANAPLGTYIAGGAIAAGAWREVTVTLGTAPLSYSGSFDRIDLQSDVAGAQPVLYVDDVTLVAGGAGPPAPALQIDRDVSVSALLSDRFTWNDGAGKPRAAVLAQTTGALREFRYQMPAGSQRIAGVTTYGNGGNGGFGYVVSHRGDGTAGIAADDSPLGFGFPGSFVRVFEGRHHAIFRFTQSYPRYSSTTAATPNHQYNVPVTIDWMISTGRDNPVWAVTWDLSGVPANALNDDSRAPYGELNIDGVGFTDIDGVAWGDRYKFFSTTAPVTLSSAWNWTQPNTVPYVKLWIAGTDATMGTVQTQTLAQQDAGAGRDPSYHDLRGNWGFTSAHGNAGEDVMPWQDSWPYQANSFSIGSSPNSNNNARLTWGTMYGFLGQSSYTTNNGLVANAPGWPRKSYSVYVVLGPHSAAPVEAQVMQVETVQSLTLSATIGSIVTSGAAGVVRPDNVTYAPAGYNAVYGVLAFNAAGNQLDANVAVGSGVLKRPLLVLGSYTLGAYPGAVKLGGVPLIADVDYFASLRPAASELWITLNRDLTGATNHLEILTSACAPVPATPVIGAPASATAGQAGLTASVTSRAGSTYAWSITNGSITAGNGTNQITFTAGAAGTLGLSVVETNSTGCASVPGTASVSVAAAPPAGLALHTMTPCRLFDTRNASGPDAATPALAALATRTIAIGGRCGLPASARALSVNVTITGASAAGGLLLYPADLSVAPVATSLSFRAGQTRANNELLSLAGDGTGFKILNGAAGTVHFILDVNGWFE